MLPRGHEAVLTGIPVQGPTTQKPGGVVQVNPEPFRLAQTDRLIAPHLAQKVFM